MANQRIYPIRHMERMGGNSEVPYACFVCGSDHSDTYWRLLGSTETTESAEHIQEMFKEEQSKVVRVKTCPVHTHPWLNNKPAILVNACETHPQALANLEALIQKAGNRISPQMIQEALEGESRAPPYSDEVTVYEQTPLGELKLSGSMSHEHFREKFESEV